MNALQGIWTALQFLFLIFNALAAAKHREEGREEVREAQQEANETAHEAAAKIDRSAADADLDALRERMRKYQRPSATNPL